MCFLIKNIFEQSSYS
uniref:Uncharacterized protein n=1 Tax=Rhizophora mucronata TaxID=61149 RepID=A0A2P2Q1Q2_RHIMU